MQNKAVTDYNKFIIKHERVIIKVSDVKNGTNIIIIIYYLILHHPKMIVLIHKNIVPK